MATDLTFQNAEQINSLMKKVHSVYVIDYSHLINPLTGGLSGYYDWYPAIQAAFDYAKIKRAKKSSFLTILTCMYQKYRPFIVEELNQYLKVKDME